jgi:CheY-like chemotaxis protein
MIAQPLVILLAEDDEGHALLIKRNLQRAGIVNHMVHVRNGQDAISYIQGDPQVTPRWNHEPLLLILDINMPIMDGIEVLAQLKGDPRTSMIPVIILTTTDDPREINRCYELGCSVYITKPVEYASFVEAVRRLGMLLQIVQIPSDPSE